MLLISVLDQTRMIDGVETRIVEERRRTAPELVEVSRNFFAIDRTTGDVFYFGEEVDIYRVGRSSATKAPGSTSTNGATFRLMVPGTGRRAALLPGAGEGRRHGRAKSSASRQNSARLRVHSTTASS